MVVALPVCFLANSLTDKFKKIRRWIVCHAGPATAVFV